VTQPLLKDSHEHHIDAGFTTRRADAGTAECRRGSRDLPERLLAKLDQVLLHPDQCVGADFDRWIAGNGGTALSTALDDPSAVIDLIERAGLRGLGGSGYPAARKWRAVAAEAGKPDKVLICNGNEDEPGTYKDRLLLEETPHQVIEGALITALATGINRIIFYVNPHLTGALAAMEQALVQWRESPWFAAVQEQTERPLSLGLLRSSGRYVGGEETAAIEWVEGKFPFPRGKPPYPAQSGVFGNPTLINNIETLANVSHIVRNGADWYRALGIGRGYGTKLYSLSGDVLRPGVYELPMGISLGELIFEYGGGMLEEAPIKAIFAGGPSNTLLTPEALDVPLDFDSVRERGAGLGTGAVIVISEGTGIVKRVAEYVGFFARSSCGQCPPCKTGTHYAAMLLEKIDTGRGTRADLEALMDLCRILPGTGRCHLLEGVVKLLDSSFTHFLHEYQWPLVDRQGYASEYRGDAPVLME
jgi:NADH-quinone oxidoreductase subunit F